MKLSSSLKIVLTSLLINLLFCCLLLPLLLQSPPQLNLDQLLETLLWQGLGLIAWPIALIMALVNFLFSGSLPRLNDFIGLILYALIQTSLILILVLKNKKWIPLIVAHILILLSFINTWIAVLRGYNFMIG